LDKALHLFSSETAPGGTTRGHSIFLDAGAVAHHADMGAGDTQPFFDGEFDAVLGVLNGFFGGGVQAGGDGCNDSCRNRIHASPFGVGSEMWLRLSKRWKCLFQTSMLSGSKLNLDEKFYGLSC
jgi:hypothetical protein